MNDNQKAWAGTVLRLVVSVALFSLVIGRISREEFQQIWSQARLGYVPALWAWSAVCIWISACKMKLILRQLGCAVSVHTLFAVSAITTFYGLFMPGALSTGAKWLLLRRLTSRGGDVLAGMIYNQLSIVAAMIGFGLGAIIVSNPSGLLVEDPGRKWILPAVCSVLFAGVVAMVVLLLHQKTGPAIIRLSRGLFRPVPEVIRSKVESVFDRLSVFQGLGVRFHLLTAALTLLAGVLGAAVSQALAARGANIQLSFVVFVWLSAIVYLLGRLPITVSNIGLRDVSIVGVLSLYGISAPAALLMSLILLTTVFFMASIGAVYQSIWFSVGNREEASGLLPGDEAP